MSLYATHLYRQLDAEQPPEDPDEADRLYERERDDVGPGGGPFPFPAAARSSVEEDQCD